MFNALVTDFPTDAFKGIPVAEGWYLQLKDMSLEEGVVEANGVVRGCRIWHEGTGEQDVSRLLASSLFLPQNVEAFFSVDLILQRFQCVRRKKVPAQLPKLETFVALQAQLVCFG